MGRFELRVEGELVGWAEYLPAGESVIIAHTEIDERREREGSEVRSSVERSIASGRAARP